MHPLNFTAIISFNCAEPDSIFVFDPGNNNSFHWYGKELDKLGSYALSQSTQLHLDLKWNYGREQRYDIVSFEGTGNLTVTFVLQNTKTGQRSLFRRQRI